MKSFSSPSLPLETSPYHKKDRLLKLERFGLFLLSLIGLTSILTFILLYTPTPFSFIPKQVPYHPYQGPSSPITKPPRHDYENCDLFLGRWIPDLNGSIYKNWTCPTLPDSKNCAKNGRKDLDYVNWRWKPNACELSRFDPNIFLSIVRGKTLAFIGDSVARNQMESLLCLLSQEATPNDIYKDSEDRFRTWYFPSHNFSLKVFWTKFFVVGQERIINGSNSGIYDLYLDKMDEEWTKKLPGVDYAIISNAHWFFRPLYLHRNKSVLGCVYCSENNITNVPPRFALKQVFRATLKYINRCQECKGIFTVLRTFSPSHFENGAWNTGGRCNRTSPRSESEIDLGGSEWELRNAQVEEIERAKKKARNESGKRFEVLDVTKAMLMRPDGHPDLNWNNQWMKGYSDCVHWCLPGPIDAWNDFLMALFIKDDDSSLYN